MPRRMSIEPDDSGSTLRAESVDFVENNRTDVNFTNPLEDGLAEGEKTLNPWLDEDDDLKDVLPESLDSPKAVVDYDEGGKENIRAQRRRVALETLSASSSLIDPDGPFRRKWDLMQMSFLVYVAFGVPYRLGFADPVIYLSGWFWFDLVVDVYFISDIFVSCQTAYWDDTGELIVESSEIRRTYMRSWFPIDLSSCFPGNYISYALDDGGSGSSKMIKLLRMLRLLKLLRLARINRLIQKYEEEFASLMTTFKLAKLIIVIIVVGHWLSCFFFFAGSIDDSSLDEYDPGYGPDGEIMTGWVVRAFDAEHCPEGSCKLQKYMTSFYWAVMTMTTVGYGDIVPKTFYEMVACTISMVIGGFIFGMIVGALAELSKRANAGELMRQEAVSKVQMILQSGVARGRVSPVLAKLIKAHAANILERNTAIEGAFSLNQFVLGLPPVMRDQMAESMHWIDGKVDGHAVYGLLHKVPFFRGIGNLGSIAICSRMKVVHMTPLEEEHKQPIMIEGESCEEMYIVIQGSKAVMITQSGNELGRLSEGDFFGELGALLPPSMSEQRKRLRSAWAVSEVQLGMITYDDLIRFRKDNMEVNNKVVEYTNAILEKMPSARGRLANLLDCHPELRLLEKKIDLLLAQK